MQEKTLFEFRSFPKIPRLSRQCVITEKIDGTNSSIIIGEDIFIPCSKNRPIPAEEDNFGFAKWAFWNRGELMSLGIGQHYGEWYGQGIQRGYGLKEKRWALFNTERWADPFIRPKCCEVVPVIDVGLFHDFDFNAVIKTLQEHGSHAVPGYMNPEGIVIYHTAGKQYFKKTITNDENSKSI